MIKTADHMKNITGYENFIAICPECGFKNIFNRISDLHDTQPIDSKLVRCQNSQCNKEFYINSDDISEPYESIIHDCYELIEEKKYMSCIINLCIGLEAFFYHAAKVKLIWNPYKGKRIITELEDVNRLLKVLQKKVDDFTYGDMRALFYDLYFFNRQFISISELESYIANLDKRRLKRDLSKLEISNCADENKKKDFHELQNLRIHSLRNDVAHKYGYRPNKIEVEEIFDKVKTVVACLSIHNSIKDVDWYLY